MVTYPLNHDIFYNRDSRFEAYFVKIPGSVERNCLNSHTFNDATTVPKSKVCNCLLNLVALTFHKETPGLCWQTQLPPGGATKIPG